MALADYYLCDVCGGKAFYDAALSYDFDNEKPRVEYGCGMKLGYVGDMACICDDCAKTHKVEVVAIAAPTDEKPEIPQGAALGANGVTYYGIEEIYHRMEEGEALHIWLDDKQVPRSDAAEIVYSLVGRVQQYVAAQSVRDAALEEAAQAMAHRGWTDSAAVIRALIQSPQTTGEQK